MSLPLATEDFPFDETTLAFRVLGKIFAMIDLEDTEWFVLKCAPDYALELRDAHPEIKGAWHMNKKYWNSVALDGSISDNMLRLWINNSYRLVVAQFSPERRLELGL